MYLNSVARLFEEPGSAHNAPFTYSREGREIKSLKLNKITVKMMRDANDVEDGYNREIFIIAKSCGVPEELLEEMTVTDFNNLREIASEDFL